MAEGALPSGFDLVLTLEDGDTAARNAAFRQLMLYEEQMQEALVERTEARVKSMREAYSKIWRDYNEKMKLIDEKAAERRRLRNLEAEKVAEAWKMEMQELHKKLERDSELRAEEFRLKTRILRELCEEQDEPRSDVDVLITAAEERRLEKALKSSALLQIRRICMGTKRRRLTR